MNTYHFVTICHPDATDQPLTVGRSNITGEWYIQIEGSELIEIAKIEEEPFIFHPRTNARLVRLNWILDGQKGSSSARQREEWMRFLEDVALPVLQFQ
jgi:hypothetical protein